MKWSAYFQNPKYLELTRKFLIVPEMIPLVRKYCMVERDKTVLDVGCGIGYFTRLLAPECKEIIGLDFDGKFVEEARKISNLERHENISFAQGDASELPFENNSFDVVVSHTFLTSAPDPKKSIEEMKRVCKSYGTIASVTTMDYTGVFSEGHYPPESSWLSRFRELQVKVFNLYESIAPLKNFTTGVKPVEMPYFFSKAGLDNVSAYPIGKFMSLSNGTISNDEKREYIKLEYESEVEKVDIHYNSNENTILTEEEYNEYKKILILRRDFLLNNIGENSIWEWKGGANLVVTGRNPLFISVGE